ncbi:MAG: hypothetical protein ABI614_08035 [Planctomycetota bacterium]
MVWLLSVPFKAAAFAFYELAMAWLLFGVCTLVWGLFRPNWIRTFTQQVAGHFAIVIAVLFAPFAFEALLLLLSGKV